jgi:hypothetical protein
MVYPATPLPVEVGLFLNGAWVDATTTGNGVREDPGVRISNGRSDWASQTDPARAGFTMRDVDGRWSPDNQGGTYWGQYRRNIPCRVGVGLGAGYLQNLGGTSGDIVSTPNTGVLNPTSQIDLRIEYQLTQDLPDTLTVGAARRLAAKGDAGSNGWFWELKNVGGRLVITFTWFDSGGGSHVANSDSVGAYVPWTASWQRIALRTTWDATTGATNHYWGTTAGGSTWNLIATITIGATSIRSAAVPLTVGGMVGDPFGDFYLPARIHAFEMRSVIAGTVVANPVFSNPSIGASTFTDGAGRVWTVGAGARLTPSGGM